jgi:uncharacterized damage-inducible protein DinB
MTWTAPEVTRTPEPSTGDELPMLQGWLDWHRQTLLHKCSGLTADQLRQRSVEPSTLSLLGLVRHCAEVERSWFRRRSGGQDVPFLYCSEADWDADFNDVDSADAEADFATYRAEVELAGEAAAGLPLEHTFAHERRSEITLRWVYLHMIEEYARHNGHADLLRERIDGATGD